MLMCYPVLQLQSPHQFTSPPKCIVTPVINFLFPPASASTSSFSLPREVHHVFILQGEEFIYFASSAACISEREIYIL